MTPVNERKVIFLGRRESGKTTMIHHLLRGTEKVASYPDREYPKGISQYTRDYPTDKGRTRIHFWDFGSDVSFRRLHPIFMTGRTVYVVMINAREGSEQRTASEWLKDIQHYAPGCPVLVVLNSVEQSLNTGVDQTALRNICPTLKDVPVVRGEDEVEQKVLRPLQEIIAEFPLWDGSIPEAWESVIRELRGRAEDKLPMSEYVRVCDDLGITQEDQIELLELCRDLGVCIWHGDGALRNHIILRQEWLTNALNAILEESDDKHGNGVMMCDTLRGILEQSKVGRILECASYSWDESNLVMSVMRRFGMLYDHIAERVFLPGLCRSGMPPEAVNDTADQRVLEVVVGDLERPESVFYGLMTQMASDIPNGSVWDGGFRFLEDAKKRSAVILLEEKGLRIYVRSRDWHHGVFDYLDQIRDKLRFLIEAYGTKWDLVQTDIVCHIGGCTLVPYEFFCMTTNDDGICYKDRSITLTRRDICSSVGALKPFISEEDELLIRDVALACEKLQDNPRYHNNHRAKKSLEFHQSRCIEAVKAACQKLQDNLSTLDSCANESLRDERGRCIHACEELQNNLRCTNKSQEDKRDRCIQDMVHTCEKLQDTLRSLGKLQENDHNRYIQDVVCTCKELQENLRCLSGFSLTVLEDDRNRYSRDVMDNIYTPYSVQDQSQRGDTPGGEGPGELDLLIQRKNGSTWTVIEALNIKRGASDKSNWGDHLFKLLHHYDKQGQPFAILLAYVEAEKDDWNDVWNGYRAHMKTYSATGRRNGRQDDEWITYQLVPNSCEDFQSTEIPEKHYRKLVQCVYETGGQQTAVIHIFVRLKKTEDNTSGEEEKHGREIVTVT